MKVSLSNVLHGFGNQLTVQFDSYTFPGSRQWSHDHALSYSRYSNILMSKHTIAFESEAWPQGYLKTLLSLWYSLSLEEYHAFR